MRFKDYLQLVKYSIEYNQKGYCQNQDLQDFRIYFINLPQRERIL
jgi:hypothetical protein